MTRGDIVKHNLNGNILGVFVAEFIGLDSRRYCVCAKDGAYEIYAMSLCWKYGLAR